MSDLGVGFVDVLPRSDAFVSALTTQMKGAFGKVQSQMASVAKSFSSVQVAAVGAGLIAATGIAKGIEATQEWAAEVRSLQRVTGLAAEDASRLAAAGTELGIPISKLNVAFGLLAKNVTNGSTNFDKYNIATKDAAGNTLPFLDILGNITDKFATLAPGTDQAAFAMNVFGRSGKDLIPVLQRGSEGLQELYDKAQAAGLVLGQDTLDASKNLTLAQRELGEAVKGASISLGEAFIPVVTKAVEVLTGFVELVQLIPKPVLSIGAALLTLAAAVIVGNKAWVALRATMSANMKLLTGTVPLIAALGFAYEVVSGVIKDASINFADLAKETKINADLLEFFADRMDLSGSAFEKNKGGLAGFVAEIGGISDNLGELTDKLQPVITQQAELGLSTEAQTAVLAQWSEQLNATTPSIDEYVEHQQFIADNIAVMEKALGKGSLTLKQFVTGLQGYGISVEDATSIANKALGEFGSHLDESGKEVANFAGMTTKKLEEWATNLTSSFRDTFTSLGNTIKDTFDTTPRELQKAFSEMLAVTIRFKRDEEALLALKPGTFGLNKTDMQGFEKYLLDQGPAFVDAFVRSTVAQQQTIVNKWQENVNTFNQITKGIRDATVTVKADTQPAKYTIDNFIAAEGQRIITIGVQAKNQFASGGVVPGFAAGGSTDTIPAMLSPGEFVMRRKAVDQIGLPTLQAMNAGGQPVAGPAWVQQKPQKMDGALRIYDWRNGLATLDAEIGWEDAVRTR